MKTKTKFWAIVSAVLLAVFIFIGITGCENTAKQQVEVNNSNFNVELLFEVDGVKVYRFKDAGYNRYFTTPSGTVSWDEKHGKTSVPMSVEGLTLDSIGQ